jgi:protein O-mannosyl-transferase
VTLQDEKAAAPFRLSTRWGLVLLAFGAVLPYLNALANGFVYDDKTQVLNNPYILSFSHLRAIFTTSAWSYVGAAGATNYYRPVMDLGYLLCYKLFGASAYGFHLASILLNAAVVCLLFEVTRRMFGRRDLAFLAAAAFALHPAHTEAVAWIASVTELEVAFFFLLTFWLFLIAPAQPGGKFVLLSAAMAVSYVLALLSKEQALMLPLVATLYEHFYREDRARTRRRAKLARYGVLWLLLAGYLVFRVQFLGKFAPVLQHPGLTRYEVVLSAVALAGHYLAKLLWPVHLQLYYAFHRSTGLFDTGFLWGAAGLLACLGLFAGLWRRARGVSFGWVWLFATLVPVLNARWLAINAFSERYLYLPSMGFCWLLAWGFLRLWEGAAGRKAAGRKMLAGGLALVAVLCAARIVTRNRVWRDDLTLYTTALAASPGAYPIRLNLGAVYFDLGELKQAEQQWLKALVTAPTSPILWNDLGLVYQKEKRYSEAVAMFHKAIELRPDYADPHLNLGVMYEKLKMLPEAERELRSALALSPLNLHLHNRLGLLYLGEGRLAEAEKQFQSSVSIAPNVVAYDGMGEIYLLRAIPGPAANAFARALALNPADVFALLKLGGLYAAQGRKAEAVRQYQAVLRFQPQNAQARAALHELNAPENHAPVHP